MHASTGDDGGADDGGADDGDSDFFLQSIALGPCQCAPLGFEHG